MNVRLRRVLRVMGRGRRRRAYHRRVVEGARGQAFIGRTVELDRLAEAWRRATAGESTLVVIAGEAGIGKSRLVDIVAARASGSGARVLRGGCLPLGTGGLPYAPFVEAFRILLRGIDPACSRPCSVPTARSWRG